MAVWGVHVRLRFMKDEDCFGRYTMSMLRQRVLDLFIVTCLSITFFLRKESNISCMMFSEDLGLCGPLPVMTVALKTRKNDRPSSNTLFFNNTDVPEVFFFLNRISCGRRQLPPPHTHALGGVVPSRYVRIVGYKMKVPSPGVPGYP